MNAPANLFLRQQGKPAFDLVQPRGSGWREVHVIAWPLGEPPANDRRLVRGVVVDDEVDVKVLGHGGLNGVEELAELGRPVTAMALSNDFAGLHVQRGEQRCRSV